MVALRVLGSLLLLSVLLPSNVLSQSSADSALNVLDSTDFFVCGSSVQGLDGHYVISDELQSDRQTPVFVREDDDQDDDLATQATSDFRLYRHNGFWLFADVAQWPPKTHFRCDPTAGSNAMAACGMNLLTPPRVGYSPVDATTAARDHLELHASDCESVLTLSTPSPKVEL